MVYGAATAKPCSIASPRHSAHWRRLRTRRAPAPRAATATRTGTSTEAPVSASVPLGVPGFELAETVAVGCSVAVGLTVGSSVGGSDGPSVGGAPMGASQGAHLIDNRALDDLPPMGASQGKGPRLASLQGGAQLDGEGVPLRQDDSGGVPGQAHLDNVADPHEAVRDVAVGVGLLELGDAHDDPGLLAAETGELRPTTARSTASAATTAVTTLREARLRALRGGGARVLITRSSNPVSPEPTGTTCSKRNSLYAVGEHAAIPAALRDATQQGPHRMHMAGIKRNRMLV